MFIKITRRVPMRTKFWINIIMRKKHKTSFFFYLVLIISTGKFTNMYDLIILFICLFRGTATLIIVICGVIGLGAFVFRGRFIKRRRRRQHEALKDMGSSEM